uniref:Uncharacterized protein n=1 Tax=Leersia perrieri TaxID=77586 RepID=A0A0D9XRB4_9ORYZ
MAGGEQQTKKVPLPPGHVAGILAMKREPWPSSEYLGLSPEERRERLEWGASRRELDDGFEEFQREVHRAVKNSGCYLVDESYFTEQAELQVLIKREWAKMDFSGKMLRLITGVVSICICLCKYDELSIVQTSGWKLNYMNIG